MKKSNSLRLGIVGHGFVGKATDFGFCVNTEKFIVDPKYKTNISDLAEFKPDVVFVCVPTPMGPDGKQNSETVERAVLELKEQCEAAVVVIKSTVLPSTLEKIHKLNNNIVYNPEFLREKHAEEDFKKAELIVFGGDRNLSEKVSKIYKNNTICESKEHIFLDLKTASLVKYTINTFLATKVTFFNELNELFKRQNSMDTWDKFIRTLSVDSRIGESHMSVPGHDGRLGFGGACFPKDSSALINYAEEQNVDLSVLKAANSKNNTIRGSYDSLQARESSQNVNYKTK